MNANEKLSMIESAFASGKTVYIVTATKATKCTPKSLANWAKAGLPLFKVSGDSLMMASGRKYVCADYCSIKLA